MKMKFICGLLLVAGLPLFFSACKDDEVKKSTISFEKVEEEVNESDGTANSLHTQYGGKGRDITVNLKLDRALAETTILSYTVGGTASRTTTQSTLSDYVIKEGTNTIVSTDKITIEKGAAEASIVVTMFEDAELEVDDNNNATETLVLTLSSVNSGTAILGETPSYTLKIKEDDAVILLQWRVDDTDSYGDADLDLFVWLDGELFDYSDRHGTTELPFEGLLIPGGFYPGQYGLSAPYYSGSSNNVQFYVVMYGNIDGTYYPYFSTDANGAKVFTGKYGQVNINQYNSQLEPTPAIIQTFSKDGINLTNVTGITVPGTGSRISFESIDFKKVLTKFSNSFKRRLKFDPMKSNLLKGN